MSGKKIEGCHGPLRNPQIVILFFENPAHLGDSVLEGHRSKTLQRFAEFDLEIKRAIPVNSKSEIDNVVKSVQEAEPDLVLCAFTSWVEEYLSIRVLGSLNVPVFLWSLPTGKAHSLLSGITATASNLRRMGKSYFHGIGSKESDEVFQKIRDCSIAGLLKQQTQNLRIGLFGQNCPGMIDVGGDDMQLLALGTQVIRYELSELIGIYERISDDHAKISISTLTKNIGVEASSEELTRSARMYLALRESIEKDRLDLVGVRCWPELRTQFKVHPCLAFSKLMDEGKLGICENDPTSGVTMWLLYHASGEAVFLGDIGRMNREDGTVSLCHCGVASTQLAENLESVRIKRYVLDPEGGLCIEFPLKKGPVTLAKLMRPQDGRFSMFVARGESVEGPEHRGSVVYVKPEVGVDCFLSKMIEEGVEHHITLGYGDLLQALVGWCKLMDIRVILP